MVVSCVDRCVVAGHCHERLGAVVLLEDLVNLLRLGDSCSRFQDSVSQVLTCTGPDSAVIVR